MPTGPQGQKRPADAVVRAVMVGRIATGEIEEVPITRRGGAGGEARAAALSGERRSEIASAAAKERWQVEGRNNVHTANKETVARGREAGCMYPNNSLGEQKKDLKDAFSGFAMLREHFKN